jgi:hypothetical protein
LQEIRKYDNSRAGFFFDQFVSQVSSSFFFKRIPHTHTHTDSRTFECRTYRHLLTT